MLLARAAANLPKGPLAVLTRALYPRVEPELRRLGEYAPRGGTAVDVGGWLGPWTQRLAAYADQVVTIEADPELAAVLRRSFPRVRVVQAAASDHSGETELWTPDSGALTGTSSVEHKIGRPRTVRTVTIDELALNDVRFIKMDIEGHELPALRGAAETIQRDRPLILLELEERHQSMQPLVDQLTTWNYEGFVMPGAEWIPLTEFDLAAHQRATAAQAGRSLPRRVLWPHPRYVNSVLFMPKTQHQPPRAALRARSR